jgi:hypothetical protein
MTNLLQPNVNQVFGHNAPRMQGAALQTFGVHQATTASATFDLGVAVLATSVVQKFVGRFDGAMGSGESQSAVLQYRDESDAVVALDTILFDENNVTAAGEVSGTLTSTAEIPAGSLLQIALTYTAGTPNAPTATYIAQVGL